MVLSVIKYLRPDCRLCCKPRCLIVSRLIRNFTRKPTTVLAPSKSYLTSRDNADIEPSKNERVESIWRRFDDEPPS